MKAHPHTEPTSDDAMAVKSVFVDLSGRARFKLSTLMRRTDKPDDA